MVYLSNQCTDAHLGSRLALPIRAYSSGWLEGAVEESSAERVEHLYIDLNAAASIVRCAVYKPAGDLHRAAGAAPEATWSTSSAGWGGPPAAPLASSTSRRSRSSVSTPDSGRSTRSAKGAAGSQSPRAGGRGSSAGGAGRSSVEETRGGRRAASRAWRPEYLPSPGLAETPDQAPHTVRVRARHVHPLIAGWIRSAPLSKLFSACAKSSIRSSGSSIPTDTLIRVSEMPVFSCPPPRAACGSYPPAVPPGSRPHAEARSERRDIQRLGELHRLLHGPLYLEAQHPAESPHLPVVASSYWGWSSSPG